MTREFVEQVLASACSYCGEVRLLMTLDRRDSALGHIQSNVVPACIRCNLTKSNMPLAAWLVIAPAMRVAREQGLFAGWAGPRIGARTT